MQNYSFHVKHLNLSFWSTATLNSSSAYIIWNFSHFTNIIKNGVIQLLTCTWFSMVMQKQHQHFRYSPKQSDDWPTSLSPWYLKFQTYKAGIFKCLPCKGKGKGVWLYGCLCKKKASGGRAEEGREGRVLMGQRAGGLRLISQIREEWELWKTDQKDRRVRSENVQTGGWHVYMFIYRSSYLACATIKELFWERLHEINATIIPQLSLDFQSRLRVPATWKIHVHTRYLVLFVSICKGPMCFDSLFCCPLSASAGWQHRVRARWR